VSPDMDDDLDQVPFITCQIVERSDFESFRIDPSTHAPESRGDSGVTFIQLINWGDSTSVKEYAAAGRPGR
jgi:hypothetical protein